MMGGNAGTKNTASSDTNARQICVSIEKRIARNRFLQNQRWSRSYRARFFFIRACVIKAYIVYIVRRVTLKCIRYALRDNRHTTVYLLDRCTSARVLTHECTHASRITILLITVPVVSLNQSLDRKRSSPIFAWECYRRDYLRFVIIASRLRRLFWSSVTNVEQ